MNNNKINNGQSNLAKGDIAHAKEILSISSIVFARWQHVWRICSLWVHLAPQFWGKERW